MKAYSAELQGGLDSLREITLPDAPRPDPGHVRIRLRSASLNYRDLMQLRSDSAVPHGNGSYIPLSDAAGEVTDIGQGVWRAKPGDRVALTFHPEWIAGEWVASPGAGGRGNTGAEGVLREEIVVHQDGLVVLPDYLSFDEAACLPCAGVTAWSALCGPAPLLPGETVLIQGTGGVALFAVQFARLFGARVIATTSSPDKADLLRQLGAETVIDYRQQPEWHEAVLAATGGLGVDLTIDLGGAATLDRSIAATRQGGRTSLVGVLTGLPGGSTGTFMRGVTTSVIRVGSRADFVAMLRAMDAHQVRPTIDRSYPFAEAIAAFQQLEGRGHIGKIVIRLDG